MALMMPQRCLRIMRATFLTGSSRDRIAGADEHAQVAVLVAEVDADRQPWHPLVALVIGVTNRARC